MLPAERAPPTFTTLRALGYPSACLPQLVTLKGEHLMVLTHNTNGAQPAVLTTDTGVGDGVWRPYSLGDGWDNEMENGAFCLVLSSVVPNGKVNYIRWAPPLCQ